MTLSLNDIYQTVRGLQIEDRRLEEVEALLVHEDDYMQLLKDVSGCFEHGLNDFNEFKMYGVKIIKSSHIQPGSIFKIFKKDKPYKYPSDQGKMWQLEYPMTIPESGSLLSPILTTTDKEEGKEEKKKHSLARKIELD